jgi:hypothetical protein
MRRGLFAAALLLSATPARAELGEAERLFLEGRQLREAGRGDEACARFRESLALAIVPNTLFNVAQCDEDEGSLTGAITRYREGLARLPEDDERREVVTRRIAAIEARLAHLSLTIAADAPASATLHLDGRVVAPGRMAVDPGKHEVRLEAPGHEPVSSTIELAEGEHRELTLALTPKRGAATPAPHQEAPPPPEGGRDALAVAGWVAVSFGAAGLIAAAATGGVLLDRDDRIRALCPAERCSPEGRAAIDQSEPLLVGNAVSWAVGIAGAGLGVSLLVASALDEPPVSVGVGPGCIVVVGSF